MTATTTILFTSDRDASLGHLGRDFALAQAFKAEGHRVVLAVPDLRAARAFLGTEFTLVQAPLLRPAVTAQRPPLNFADMLLNTGFSDVVASSAAVDAWLALMEMIKPAMVVYGNSPAALIAARITKIPVKLIGSAFEIPPAATPLPLFLSDIDAQLQASAEIELAIVGRINALLSRHGCWPIEHLSDLFPPEDVYLTTTVELDPFGPRPDVKYIGPIFELSRPPSVGWAEQIEEMPMEPRRIFANLFASTPGCENLLEALHSSRAEVICVMPSCPDDWVKRFDRITFYTRPLPLALLLPKADLVMTSGVGLLTTSLLASVPVLFVPRTAEQSLVGKAALQTQAVELFSGNLEQQQLLRILRNMLTIEQWRTNAFKFAERYFSMAFENNSSALGSLLSGATAPQIRLRDSDAAPTPTPCVYIDDIDG